MTKKLLLSAVTLAITAGMATAALHPVQLNNAEFLKKNFSAANEQASVLAAPIKKAPAADTQVFFEDFEEPTQAGLPQGWITTDNLESAMTVTDIASATSGYYNAFSGINGLTSMYDDNNSRDGWVISTGITLEANQTYHFGIYAFCMGYGNVIDEWELTIGDAQTADSQTTVIIDHTGSNATQDATWTLFTGTFTPTTAGTYYIGIHHCTQALGGNIAMWDYLQVDSDHIKIFPEGSMFSKGGLWSMDGHTQDENGNIGSFRAYLYEGEQLQYGCTGKNIESLFWEFGQYGTADNAEAAQPIVTYSLPANTDEVYNDVLLAMINSDGESYAMREFYINRINNNTTFSDFVGNIRPEDGFYVFTSGGNYDALSGLNSYYTRMAERYLLPADATVAVSGGYIIPINYNLSVINRKKEFTVRVLGADANNNPGEVLYSQNYKFEDVFGTQGFQGAAIAGFIFDNYVTVKGTFFIEFEFPEISVSSNNRLFFATSNARLLPDDYSTYFYNATATSGVEAGWYNSIDYCEAGISTAIFPLVTFEDKAAVSVTPQNDYTVYANGNQINVVNAETGSNVIVTDIAGRVVLEAEVNNFKTTIDTNLNAGIYIVTVNGESTKVVIR